MLPHRWVAMVAMLSMAAGFAAGHLAVMSIDLGSEFMKIAIVKPGIPMEIITNEDSARKTATMVVMRNGERLFGNPAENMATRFPSKAYWYLTQIVGKKFEDPAVAQYQKRFPYYNLIRDEERGTVLFKVDEETQYSPEELLAMILEKAKSYAETFADQTIKDAVITVPSYFNQAERRSVRLAASMSGLNVLQLMGDNAAVALNYGVFRRKQFDSTMTYIMFYDMGATSTTATIVGYQVVKMKEGTRVVENPQLVIKGVGFDRELGGLEISIRLRDHLAKLFTEKKKTKTDIYTNHRAMAKLLKEAKRVKKVLSANSEHYAQVEGLLDDEDFRAKVTRAEMEDLCADMFERTTKPIEDALKASEITLGEISDVILMGGGTRIPKVQENLQAFLGRQELGKSINTDEAAALGAVYQAAHLGKGFKVMTFGVKEANVYPIVVEFEKHRNESADEPVRLIKRTLFGRMNPFPQKKVMTFNKHFKDFSFNVSYGDLDFLPEAEAKLFRELQGMIHNVSLFGVEDAYAKHTDAQEAKGIKAHFRMDESGILTLDHVETVFEKEDKEVKDESTWSKIGDTISGLFSSKDEEGKQAEGDDATKTEDAEKKPEGEAGETEQKEEPAQPDPAQSTESPDTGKDGEEAGSEEEQKEEQTDGGEKEEKKEEKKEESTDSAEEKKEEKEDKKEEKKDEGKEEEGEKKTKIIVVKENITMDMVIMDLPLPSKESLKASKKKMADLTAVDKEKKLLEKAKNELESFIYDMGDRLTQPLYEQCSTEEEREKFQASLAEASDWLYEQEEDAKKEVFTDKLKSLKKSMKDLEMRVREVKERPEALSALDSMLNHSQVFLNNIKNLSTIDVDDSIFTPVEIETLEKLINETTDWKNDTVKEQKSLKDYEKPKLLLEDIGLKMQALDREVKYLINKAKNFKPKTKPKASKNKTSTTKNDTVTEDDGADKKEDEETTSPEPDTESEIPAPPTEDTEDNGADVEVEGEEDLDVEAEEATTKKPVETNTHDAGDL